MASAELPRPAPGAAARAAWPVSDYDLAATLDSGQAFRWQRVGAGWEGVVAGRWVRLTAAPERIEAETAVPQTSWDWLADYLQIRVELAPIQASFPDDAPLRSAVAACRGLRLLRQEPWECLASFILSSTKQIVHIRQIVETLCQRYGEPVAVPAGQAAAFAFPTAARLAAGTEAELRACRMGFRAPYLLAAAQRLAAGDLDLAGLAGRPLAEARAELMRLDGVGRKIADCVLLFAVGFQQAFPVDVWVAKALRELYFRGRRVAPRKLLVFSESHFGPHAGYAQQYLFHYRRTQATRTVRP